MQQFAEPSPTPRSLSQDSAKAAIRLDAVRRPQEPPTSPESLASLEAQDQDPERWDGLS